ncbi:hypothetical protein L596_017577 [Steinernema carpocapsae]|uniref:Uncharacterized protein n=1 Tax=Steinernema carpocapsae TaxID=34508 RepID=A0A4U5N2U3_STECR|nr:hypothetical protein L596_017577 [Steinernema carpocapsae]
MPARPRNPGFMSAPKTPIRRLHRYCRKTRVSPGARQYFRRSLLTDCLKNASVSFGSHFESRLDKSFEAKHLSSMHFRNFHVYRSC